MKIVATSDLHGNLPIITSCNLLIIAGDITPPPLDCNISGQTIWLESIFIPWLNSLDAEEIVIIPGNHDDMLMGYFSNYTEINPPKKLGKAYLLCNSYIEIEGLRIYGAPLVTAQSNHTAFTLTQEELKRCCNYIPQKLDILVTHNPPFGVNGIGYYPRKGKDNGSETISEIIKNREIKHLICGHIHEANHKPTMWYNTLCRNVSYCNSDNLAIYDIHFID